MAQERQLKNSCSSSRGFGYRYLKAQSPCTKLYHHSTVLTVLSCYCSVWNNKYMLLCSVPNEVHRRSMTCVAFVQIIKQVTQSLQTLLF